MGVTVIPLNLLLSKVLDSINHQLIEVTAWLTTREHQLLNLMKTTSFGCCSYQRFVSVQLLWLVQGTVDHPNECNWPVDL
jgi:hypothetical protein